MIQGLKYSIIIPVCHGGDFIKNALASLRQVDFSPEHFEVLVSGSNDDKESRATANSESERSAFHIEYISSPEPTRSKLLNAAYAVARGQVLVFADDDCIFRKDWLKKLSTAIERDPDTGIIGGRDTLERNESAFGLALDNVLTSFIGTGGLRRGVGLRTGKYYPKLWNMAVPREVATSVALKSERGSCNLFDESLGAHEDVELASRIEKSGKRILYAAEVSVGHSRDTTFCSFFVRNFVMGRASRRLGVHRLPHVALGAFWVTIPALVIGSLFLSPLRVTFLFLAGIYGAALAAHAVGGFWRTRNFKVLVMIPALLVSLHFTRGIGYLLPYPITHGKENP